jgi:glycosyltransferase involved in cell wall biosynthesis
VEGAAQDKPKPLTVCLVIDEQAAECFPTALRYLQIGLIDEPVDTVIIASERGREVCLAGGPATVIAWREAQWPFGGFGRRAAVEAVCRRAAASGPEGAVVVHGLSLSAAQISEEIAEAVGGQLMLTVSRPSELADHAIGRCCRKAAVLVAPTRRILRSLQDGGHSGPAVECVPVGVVSTFAPAAFSNAQRAPSLVYIGPLSAESGVEVLLRAVKTVLASCPNLLVFIVGKGAAEGSLRHLADSLELSSNVTFTGRLEHWRLALDAADVFCVPSGRDGFHEEAVHALAAGAALVASADSDCDGLVDGESALCFPPGDHFRMAEQISRLVEDQSLARRLATAGQAFARSNNSVAKMVSEHVRVYQQLGARHRTIPMPLPQ